MPAITDPMTMKSMGMSPRVMASPSEMAPMIAENEEKTTMASSMNAVRRLPNQI